MLASEGRARLGEVLGSKKDGEVDHGHSRHLWVQMLWVQEQHRVGFFLPLYLRIEEQRRGLGKMKVAAQWGSVA